jgi:uncharacterized membrane protein YdfJ with MMPL/SSD domain
MVTVFSGFMSGQDPLAKMMGLGLATAIAIDATIVRLVLVPATMTRWRLKGMISCHDASSQGTPR